MMNCQVAMSTYFLGGLPFLVPYVPFPLGMVKS